jgi:hypothetical protein
MLDSKWAATLQRLGRGKGDLGQCASDIVLS